jgi:predicted AAA+ superfamily ATPase
VGKTTLVHQFARRFEQYIYLNLELPEDKQLFDQFKTIELLLQSIFFLKNKVLSRKNQTLIFIDEIQEVPGALMTLRYFYENEPNLPVIAAGSMLESLFNKNIHFPVGRVEYKVLRPVSFPEFLLAIGEKSSYEALHQIPVPEFAHTVLLRWFHTYAIVGGMPAVVQEFVRTQDFKALAEIYDSLIASYLELFGGRGKICRDPKSSAAYPACHPFRYCRSG